MSGAYPASLVDVGRVWRTRLESGVDWLVAVGVWVHGRDLSIRGLPPRRVALWPAARLHHLHRLLCDGDHHVPIRELCAAPRGFDHGTVVSDFRAAVVV